jgi:hypothetical protein
MYRFFQDAESDSERTVAGSPLDRTPSVEKPVPRPAAGIEFGDMEDDSVAPRRPAAG